jgi:DNA-binding LacI/PurR family transcriptional regulator
MSSETDRSPARVTLRDVAREARVSPAAVSRALNPAGPASPAMRDRVARAASKLGYTPNIIARSLSRGRSGIIALIMPAPSRPFYADAVAAAARTLQENGRRLMVVEADETDPDTAIADVLPYSVDGIILASAQPAPAMLELCRREDRGIVVFNRQPAMPGLSFVACDDHAAGMSAGRLLARRHRRAAFLGGTPDSATHADRLAGFRQALKAARLPPPEVALGGWRYEQAFAATTRLLAGAAPPDALFCANDVMACAAVDAARRLGLSVPLDLSVIGFDDSIGAGWDAYRLTTFRVPLGRMVAAALEALNLPPGAPPLRLRLSAELVERDSVRYA